MSEKKPSKREVATFLRKCANYIQRYGWHQWATYLANPLQEYPAVCLLGSVRAVNQDGIPLTHGILPDGPIAEAAFACIGLEIAKLGYSGSIAGYNDFKCTKARQVTALLRGAAGALDHGGLLLRSVYDVAFDKERARLLEPFSNQNG